MTTYQEHSEAVTAFVLGIVGIFIPIFAPFAWYIGRRELRGIDAGMRSPEYRSLAQIGMIFGLVMTVLMVVGLAILAFFIILAIANN